MALRVWLPLNGNLNNQGISDITITNNEATVDNNGKIGKCYKFTTSQSLMSIDFARNSISYASWIYITASDVQALINNQTYDSSYNTSGGDIIGRNSYGGLSIRWQTNNLASNKNLTNIYLYGSLRSYDLAETSSASVYATTAAYNLNFNTWTHVALTWNKENKELNLYINGVLFNSTILSKSPEIGARNTVVTAGLNQKTWDGGNGRSLSIPIKYNDVRIYDHAISPKEVKEIAKGLCLHYKLDGVCNTIDNTEWDCSGFRNNGTKSGNITLVDSGGRYSKAYSFPNNCNTKVYSTVAPKLLKNLTFSCWCKVQQGSNSTWSFIVSQGRDSTADGFNIILNSSLHYCIHGPFGTVDSGISANNTWTHVVGTYDGANVKIFINGILKNTQAYTANLVYNYAPAFVVGKMSYNYTSDGSYFPTNGAISDVRVYATALSDADVLELYNTSLSIDNVGNIYTYEFKEIE